MLDGKDKISVDLFLFLNFLFKILIFLLFERSKDKLIFLFKNLYFVGKASQILLKKKSFWNSEFYVNKNTLIPRPDTEIILEQVLKFTKNKNYLNILDIGVGSGCILLSILKERKNFYGTGIDINRNSLDICKMNAKKLLLDRRVKFFNSDVINYKVIISKILNIIK